MASLPALSNETLWPSPEARDSISTADSFLERPLHLAALVDKACFEKVFGSFRELTGVNVTMLDREGTVVAGSDGTPTIARGPETFRKDTVVESDALGLRYSLVPIIYGGEILGRLIYGPYSETAQRPDVPVVDEAMVAAQTTHLVHLIDTVVRAGYKARITEHLHVESVETNYAELAETNVQLRESLAKLQELDKLKANFLAMISHELRTPLTSIIGYSEMLLDDMAGPLVGEQIEFLQTIKEKGQSLLGLIGSLLDVTKIEAGSVSFYFKATDLRDVITSSHRMIIPELHKAELSVNLEIDPDLPKINADPEKIGQSIVNLLTNAVKFTPKGGRIDVRARRWTGVRRYSGDATGRFGADDENFIRIDVVDSGVGIPAREHQNIFRPFYQVDNSAKRAFGGTGLGLAIVKNFVDGHDGEVWVESEETVGSTFTILLPV